MIVENIVPGGIPRSDGAGVMAGRLIVTLSIILVSAISLFATANGVASSVNIPSKFAMPFGYLVSFLVQVFIWHFWRQVVSIGQLYRSKLISTFLALTFSIFSGTLASGTYLLASNQQGLESLFNQRQMLTISKPLQELESGAFSIATAMSDFAADALQKAKAEEDFGNTCPGGNSGDTCGPRCEMRKRMAQEAKTIASTARTLASEAADLVVQSGQVSGQANMNDVWKRARLLANDERFFRIERTLNEKRSDFEMVLK